VAQEHARSAHLIIEAQRKVRLLEKPKERTAEPQGWELPLRIVSGALERG